MPYSIYKIKLGRLDFFGHSKYSRMYFKMSFPTANTWYDYSFLASTRNTFSIGRSIVLTCMVYQSWDINLSNVRSLDFGPIRDLVPELLGLRAKNLINLALLSVLEKYARIYQPWKLID